MTNPTPTIKCPKCDSLQVAAVTRGYILDNYGRTISCQRCNHRFDWQDNEVDQCEEPPQ